ncbi:MAG: PHB depolymerase family esterase [Planctomycetota bacterium]
MLRPLLLTVLASFNPVSPPAAETSAANQLLDELKLESVETADGTRFYRTYVPQGTAPEGGFPLVVCFHGGGSSALGPATNFGLLEEAAARGYMAVFPEGTNFAGETTFGAQFWNSSGTSNGTDDIGFFASMIAELESDHPLDPSRVFLTGKSNGAMLAYTIGVRRPELVAGLAPVSGALLAEPPAVPEPLLGIHDLFDPIVQFEGLGPVPSQVETITHFLDVNSTSTAPAIAVATETYLFYSWNPSSTGAPTWYFLTPDGGHSWPGEDPATAPPGQAVHSTVSASWLMLEFFSLL